jgi:FkbM family methyltransferase
LVGPTAERTTAGATKVARTFTLAEMGRLRRLLLDLFGVWRTADLGTASRWTLAVALHLPTVVRTGRLEVADQALVGRRCRFRMHGVEIDLPGEYFNGAREIYCRRVYEFRRRFDIGPNDVVVDLGCNVGVFTVLAASLGKEVIAVEAQSGLIAQAESNLRLNRCADRARIVHALVGAETGVFSVDRELLGDPSIGDPPTMSVREVFGDVPVVDLMKIDIEGSEFALCAEDRETRWLDRVQRVTMEVHPEFGSAPDLVATLAAHGLESQFVTNHGSPTASLDEIGFLFGWRE